MYGSHPRPSEPILIEKKEKATVTLPLSELDSLRGKITQLEADITRLKEKKEVTLTIDGDIYDYKTGHREYGHRMKVYGNYNEIYKDGVWQETQALMHDMFGKILTQSEERKFYNKFPSWIHTMFGCK